MQFKKAGKKFATITAYDFTTTQIVEQAEIPLILVGDSASMMIYGYNTTIPVSMEEMLFVIKAVTRAALSSLVVADMPFLSYQTGVADAVKNAGILIKKGGAGAISVTANIAPKLCSDFQRFSKSNNDNEIKEAE